MVEVRWGAATDSGQIRPDNEDSYLTEPRVFAVADGMGGHRAGEVASAITVDLLRSRLSAAGPGLDEVLAAIAEANRDIYDAANENPDQQGMGTTVTVLAVTGGPEAEPLPGDDQPTLVEPTSDEAARAEGSASDEAQSSERASSERDQQFVLANVGDSRTYLLRHDRMRRLTVDHNYVQELIAAGHITDDEARTHPRRNIVTRALGIDPTVRVDAWTLPVVRGDRFLLCSDGLVDEVRDDDIARVLTTITDPQTAADELVALANRHGGRDNVTVVVVDVLEGADPPDPDTELDLEPAWEESAPDSTWAADGPVEEEATEYADLAELVSPHAAAATTEAAEPSAPVEERPRQVTDEVPVVPVEAGAPPRRRRRRVAGFLWAVGVLAVLVLAFVILAAWARRGYFVAFDDGGDVIIYRGQPDGVLWFEPTEEAPTVYDRSSLDARSVDRVDGQPEFDSRRAAERFIDELLVTTTTSPTTTTTTTVAPTTTTTTTTTTVP
jgi:protein phosphatase